MRSARRLNPLKERIVLSDIRFKIPPPETNHNIICFLCQENSVSQDGSSRFKFAMSRKIPCVFVSRLSVCLWLFVNIVTFPSDAGNGQVGGIDGRIESRGQIEIADCFPDTQNRRHSSGTTMSSSSRNRKDLSSSVPEKPATSGSSRPCQFQQVRLRATPSSAFPTCRRRAYLSTHTVPTQTGRPPRRVPRRIAIPDRSRPLKLSFPPKKPARFPAASTARRISSSTCGFHSSADYSVLVQWTIAIYPWMLGIICTFTAMPSRSCAHPATKAYYRSISRSASRPRSKSPFDGIGKILPVPPQRFQYRAAGPTCSRARSRAWGIVSSRPS